MPSDFEDLKTVGTPIKELTKGPNSSFQELSSIKEIITPLKDLEKIHPFSGLNSLKEGFEPLKPGHGPKPDHADSNSGNNESHQTGANDIGNAAVETQSASKEAEKSKEDAKAENQKPKENEHNDKEHEPK